LNGFKVLSIYDKHALRNKKGTFLEIINKFLLVIYIFFDNLLKFGIVCLHIVLLTNNEFCGKGYNQSETFLKGVNESLLCRILLFFQPR
jgi:hypothetical protein